MTEEASQESQLLELSGKLLESYLVGDQKTA